MMSIERFFRSQFIDEQLNDLEGSIAAIETSLGDCRNTEIEAYNEASQYLLKARKALERAQTEARKGCEQELLQQQLTESICRFSRPVNPADRCEQIGSGR